MRAAAHVRHLWPCGLAWSCLQCFGRAFPLVRSMFRGRSMELAQAEVFSFESIKDVFSWLPIVFSVAAALAQAMGAKEGLRSKVRIPSHRGDEGLAALRIPDDEAEEGRRMTPAKEGQAGEVSRMARLALAAQATESAQLFAFDGGPSQPPAAQPDGTAGAASQTGGGAQSGHFRAAGGEAGWKRSAGEAVAWAGAAAWEAEGRPWPVPGSGRRAWLAWSTSRTPCSIWSRRLGRRGAWGQAGGSEAQSCRRYPGGPRHDRGRQGQACNGARPWRRLGGQVHEHVRDGGGASQTGCPPAPQSEGRAPPASACGEHATRQRCMQAGTHLVRCATSPGLTAKMLGGVISLTEAASMRATVELD